MKGQRSLVVDDWQISMAIHDLAAKANSSDQAPSADPEQNQGQFA